MPDPSVSFRPDATDIALDFLRDLVGYGVRVCLPGGDPFPTTIRAVHASESGPVVVFDGAGGVERVALSFYGAGLKIEVL